MQITRGIIKSAKKVVIYGPEGIGKTTFASRFPEPVFIDTEGSTKALDVARLPKPTSWTMLFEEIRYIMAHPEGCCTLVIDTIDWAEQLCIQDVCARYNKKGIEDFGYGNGYVYEKEEFGKLLNLLEEVIENDINVVITAHAQMRKFEQPDEMGAYDRWELKLGKKTGSQISPLVKEWADMVLFANYKTFAVAADDKGKKYKAQGGKRVMYTTHHPCWDAKNRDGLDEMLPFDYSRIAHCIPIGKHSTTNHQELKPSLVEEFTPLPDDEENPFAIPEEQIPGIPRALSDLMIENGITEREIQTAVAYKGYYPEETPIAQYDPNFIDGVLVGAWGQVRDLALKLRDSLKF